jgi:hypothetical protein
MRSPRRSPSGIKKGTPFWTDIGAFNTIGKPSKQSTGQKQERIYMGKREEDISHKEKNTKPMRHQVMQSSDE